MFQIEHSGLEEAQHLMNAIEKIAGVRMSADLNAKERHDNATLNNAEILEFLARQGRNFVTPSPEALKEIDRTVLEYLEKGLDKYRVGRSGSRITSAGEMNEGKARQVLGSAFRAAAKVWKKEITRRIEEGDFEGGGDKELSPEYEAWKKKNFNFAYPIGKATGQLLDNVKPDSRNLKLRRG